MLYVPFMHLWFFHRFYLHRRARVRLSEKPDFKQTGAVLQPTVSALIMC